MTVLERDGYRIVEDERGGPYYVARAAVGLTPGDLEAVSGVVDSEKRLIAVRQILRAVAANIADDLFSDLHADGVF